MEVRINLLPQFNRRKEKRIVYRIPVLGLILVAIAASFLTYSYFHTKSSIKTLSQYIATQTIARDNLLNEYKINTTGVTEFNFTDKYVQLDQFLNSIYKNTIDLQESLKKMLPDKATVISYSYLNSGELMITIDFASKGDSALFLHQLLRADFVKTALIESISVSENGQANTVFHVKLDTFEGGEK